MAPPLCSSLCFAAVYSKSFQLGEALSLLFHFSCSVVAANNIISSFLSTSKSLTGLLISTGYRLVVLNYSDLAYSGDYRKDCVAVTH